MAKGEKSGRGKKKVLSEKCPFYALVSVVVLASFAVSFYNRQVREISQHLFVSNKEGIKLETFFFVSLFFRASHGVVSRNFTSH